MNQLFAITSRNLKQFLRDKGAIFFSLLSMMIIILLMFFFLGDANTEGITELLGSFPDRDAAANKENAKLLMLVWTCAGMVSTNAVTVTISSLSYMIKDRENGKLSSIYTAPVSRFVIAAGYVLAAWISSVIICTATLLISELYCVSQGVKPFSPLSHLRLFGMICANSFAYATLMYLVAALVKSNGAWGGLGTIVGTLVGFLGGIYLPIGQATDTIAGIMKCTPVIYGTAMFRSEMVAGISERTFQGIPVEVVTEFDRIMGNELTIGEHPLSTPIELTVLLGCGTVFLIGGALAVRFSKRTDR
ncbi:MAG: ABC transporter permease [Oscillospiraceae bacterium]|nr:ABC transporter permease [Oscillospiraceae bacterium]